MKCKLRVCCLVKNAPLCRTSYHLRKGKKKISEGRKTFLQDACDHSSLGLFYKEFCSFEGLIPNILTSGEGSVVHCPEVWEGWVTSPYLHHEVKPGKCDSDLLISQRCGLKAKQLLSSQPLFPQIKWFPLWKKAGDTLNYTPSPCQFQCYVFLSSKFSHPKSNNFCCLKKSKLLLNISQVGFHGFLTCEEGKTILRDLNQEANRSSEDFLGIRSLKTSGHK